MASANRTHSDVARLSSAFAVPVIRDLGRPDPDLGSVRLAPIQALRGESTSSSLGEAFDLAHGVLSRNYKTEYVYKNEIISKIVLGRHSVNTASALLEAPMGRSCADVVIVNRTTSAYEVKTDHDDFSRLGTQLRDYSTRVEFVNVVVSERRADRVLSLLPSRVGVIAYRSTGSLGTVRRARSNKDYLDVDHMFQMLRTPEALEVLNRFTGYELDVPPGYAFARMRELFSRLPPTTVHAGLVGVLKARGRTAGKLVTTPGFPESLRALAYAAEFSEIAARRLLQRLS